MPSKIQSPPYPKLPFEFVRSKLRSAEASLGARQVEGEARVLALLGYGGVSGRSKDTLNTLRQHGLLEKVPGGFRFTDLASAGVGDDDSALHARAAAAWKPPVFRRLLEVAGREPAEAEAARVLAEAGFGPSAAGTILKNYLAVSASFEPPSDEIAKGSPAPGEIREEAVSIEGKEPGRLQERGSRKVFEYEFETGAAVVITVNGVLGTDRLMAVVTDWMAMKRRELGQSP